MQFPAQFTPKKLAGKIMAKTRALLEEHVLWHMGCHQPGTVGCQMHNPTTRQNPCGWYPGEDRC